jgi:subtilisin family serine protease
MSLGGSASTALDNAVTNSIASGVTYGIAAGNGNVLGIRKNACNTSPARVPTAITVGATQNNDAAASFSNYGTCVDILAPGVNITSAWYSSNTATNTISGTSMATPHVVGAAALVLAANPSFTPAQVASSLTSNATSGVVTNVGTGTPNRLLYVVN